MWFNLNIKHNNVEIIQAQLNKLTVTSVYKPPNEQFNIGSNLASTPMNVVIGDFNSHGVEWGYRSTDENGRLVEQWSETNQLSLVHDAKHPFNEDTVRVGDALLDEISEAQHSKWKEMIESTDVTYSSRKAWKTINKLTKVYTKPQQQCKVTADQVAHQLLLNGKGNKLHVPRREKMPRQTVTESK